MPKLYRCTAKFLRICYQTFTYDEMMFLIDHGNVEEISTVNVKIYENNDLKELVPFEKLFEKMPRVQALE